MSDIKNIIRKKIATLLEQKGGAIERLYNECKSIYDQKPVSLSKISIDKQSIDILILTATEIETKALLHILQKNGENNWETCLVNGFFYHAGKIGLYNIVHVQSEPGAERMGASYDATRQAIKVWNPKMVISVGIAYGKEPAVHQLGDVLFLTHAITYSGAKISDGKIFYHNGGWAPSSDPYLNRVVDFISKLKHGFNLHSGTMITGENIIDNEEYKTMLFDSADCLEPIGGEMESYGIYKAAFEARIQYCFVLKGVCDWGVSKNDIDKITQDKIQYYAADNALSLVTIMLSDKLYFNDIGIQTVGDYAAVLRIKEQLYQHPKLIQAVEEVHKLFEYYRGFYGDAEFISFLNDMKEFGFCDHNNNLTEKGVLLLFSLPSFNPKSLYKDNVTDKEK
ncbi:hypothetical protein AGMMS50212_01940 [Spirochaetia bacterium]|nr:hypothetical protein AGMMS50212_01940 [Spirochaetia bacterium]